MAMRRRFDTLEALLHNLASEIPRAHQALDQFAAQRGLSGPYIAPLHLALEEHLTNVVSYGNDKTLIDQYRILGSYPWRTRGSNWETLTCCAFLEISPEYFPCIERAWSTIVEKTLFNWPVVSVRPLA